jgi:hypothetical protein
MPKIEDFIVRNVVLSDTCPKCWKEHGIDLAPMDLEDFPEKFQDGKRRVGMEREFELECIDFDRERDTECGHVWKLVLRVSLERKDE